MIFYEEFQLNCPVEEAWEFFTDFPGPILVIPGARQVRLTGPQTYSGLAEVRIGPFVFNFRGEMHILKVDHSTRQVVLRGGAQDHNLGGQFAATAYTRTLPCGPRRSRVTLEVHVGLGGLLGKLGMLILKPRARSIVAHYAELTAQELGRRRMERALREGQEAGTMAEVS